MYNVEIMFYLNENNLHSAQFYWNGNYCIQAYLRNFSDHIHESNVEKIKMSRKGLENTEEWYCKLTTFIPACLQKLWIKIFRPISGCQIQTFLSISEFQATLLTLRSYLAYVYIGDSFLHQCHSSFTLPKYSTTISEIFVIKQNFPTDLNHHASLSL